MNCFFILDRGIFLNVCPVFIHRLFLNIKLYRTLTFLSMSFITERKMTVIHLLQCLQTKSAYSLGAHKEYDQYRPHYHKRDKN